MSVSAGVLSRLKRKIYTYIMSVSASTFALGSIFLFEQELRTARVLRNHLWCSFTFRTKNIHIYVCFCRCSFTFRTKIIHMYHVCFCQHILATIDITNEMRELRIERSVNTHSLLRVSVKFNEMQHTICKL